MANDPVIVEARYGVLVTLGGSGVSYKPGDLLGYSAGWVQADADTAALYARLICGGYGRSGDTVTAYREALLYDADAPYTADTALYLSGTAAAHTATRPTTAAQLRQAVGVALATDTAHLMLAAPREVEAPLTLLESTSGESALGSRVALDSGVYEGLQLNASGEYVTFGAALPEGCVAVVKAEVWAAQESSPGGTPTFDFTVNSVVASGNWDAVTADTSETGKTLAANGAGDPIACYDFSAALDATNIVRPGALLAVKVAKADGGTDATLVFGGRIVCRVV
ncbi:MAG: hypothetical protein NTZ05_19080 [Chloroflexi bacterium]|nr:hypothetical protein [Chloroflexota bacterium]